MKQLIVALLLVVALGAGFVVFENNKVLSRADAAYAKLNEVLAHEDEGTISDQEVHELLGLEPDVTDKVDRHTLVETYKFEGMMRSATLKVQYRVAATTLLHSIELN